MKLVLGLLFIGLAFGATAQKTSGIDFFHGTYAEGLAKAKKEGKMVFVDAYAVWCGPCKFMAAKTFTDEAVGKYYNDNFVCMKIDMEKGEGRELARKWAIRGYPTLLYFNAEGEQKKREMGGRNAKDFLKLGQSIKQ